MKEIICLAFVLIYMFSVTCLTCYMTIHHGWYWIFLILMCGIKYKSDEKEGG